jgi:hypothetical protein
VKDELPGRQPADAERAAPSTLALALARASKPILALVGVALLGIVLSKLSRAELWAALVRVGPAGLWTVPLWCVGMLCNSLTLRALVPARLPLRGLWHNRFISESYNNLLPLLGFGGEAFKVKYLARYVPVERAVGAMVQERLVDAVVDFFYTSLTVALGASLLALSPAGRKAAWAGVALSLVLALLTLVAVATPLTGRLSARLGRWLGGSTPAATRAPARARLVAAGWNLASRLLGIFEMMLLLRLLGHPAPLVLCCFIQGAISVVGTLSWFIPGSIGATEAGTVVAFHWLGLPAADGMAFALVRRARLTLTSSFGVILYALQLRRR